MVSHGSDGLPGGGGGIARGGCLQGGGGGYSLGGLYRYDKRTYKKSWKSESDMSAGMSTKGIRKTLASAETLT